MKANFIKVKDQDGESTLILMVRFIKVNGKKMRNQVLESIFLTIENYFQDIGVIIINFMDSIKFKVQYLKNKHRKLMNPQLKTFQEIKYFLKSLH